MTAAVYAARKRIDALFLSKDIGGQAMWATKVENYMGYQYIEGFELMHKFEEQVKQFPLEQKIGDEVVALSRLDTGFEVKTAKGESYQAKAVIVATGKRPRPLNVPGEKHLIGRGLTYCAVCDGPLFTGQKVAVIGGGNSALEATDDMVKIAEYVYLVSLTTLTGSQILIDRVVDSPNLTVFTEHEVIAIEGESRVEAIVIKDLKSNEEKRLEVGGVFIEIGLLPNSELTGRITKLNDLGEVEVNCANETGVPGLFAAGDVTNVVEKQIVVAAGEGAKATLQAHKYIQRL